MTNTYSAPELMSTLTMKKSKAEKRCKITLLHWLGMVMVTTVVMVASQLLLTLQNYSLAV